MKIVLCVIQGFEYVQNCALRWSDRRHQIASGRPTDDSKLSKLNKHQAFMLIDLTYRIN